MKLNNVKINQWIREINCPRLNELIENDLKDREKEKREKLSDAQIFCNNLWWLLNAFDDEIKNYDRAKEIFNILKKCGYTPFRSWGIWY